MTETHRYTIFCDLPDELSADAFKVFADKVVCFLEDETVATRVTVAGQVRHSDAKAANTR